jgi:ubiquinone biosynthesis protein COQ4
VPAIQFQPMRAFRAARVLFDDPDNLPQVFTIIEALSLNTQARIVRRMKAHEVGRRLLQTRPDIVDLLADREALAKLPEGSLGRAYLSFVERENISAEGIRSAAEQGSLNGAHMEPPFDWMYARMRDTHDLWHAATGYSGDVLGELALLAFTFAQVSNPAIALIICLGLIKTLGEPEGDAVRATILDGYRRGARAKWLPAQAWEQLLSLPVSVVRERLALGATPVYAQIRSAQLRAA